MADQKAENIAISSQPQKTIMEFETPKKPKTNKYALGCAMLASMTSVLLGYGQYIYIHTCSYYFNSLIYSRLQTVCMFLKVLLHPKTLVTFF